jgi:protease I
MKKALLVIAPKGYQDVELNGTRTALEALGFTVTIASTEVGDCIGKFGGTEQATVALRNINVDDYDRIAFIGGPGAHDLIDDIYAKATAILAAEHSIPLGAICIAPLILANAGLLDGKNATCWDKDGTQFAYLAKNGAIVDQFDPVVVDGLIVTANGPDAAEEFGTTFGRIRH